MKFFFSIRALFSVLLSFSVFAAFINAQTVDCSKIVHIYAATTNATNPPSEDASTIYTYASENAYQQTVLVSDLKYPNLSYIPSYLRNKNIQLNGLALNPKDGFLYGFNVIDSNRLLKMNNVGKVLAIIKLKPQGGSATNTFPKITMTDYFNFTSKVGGACFSPNGTMYVATSTQSTTNGQPSTTGSSTIWTITGLENTDTEDNYSRKIVTDDLADGGFGDLLINIKDQTELYVATVGRYGANGGIVKGIKRYRINTSPWADLGMIMVSTDSFQDGNNYAVLGMSYNQKGDFVGLTSTQASTRLLFTMDECGNIIEYVRVSNSPFTGDGTSIFPF